MGWTLAIQICQLIHERVVDAVRSSSFRFTDGIPGVPFGSQGVHTEYVDHFVGLSHEESVSRDMAVEMKAALTDLGLPIHPVEVTCGGKTLGWEFHELMPWVGPSLRSVWKLRFAIEELLRRRWCSRRQM